MPALFNYPASYLPHVEAYIAIALREIKADQKARANGKKPIVPDNYINVEFQGRITIVSVPDMSQSDNLGDHLHALCASPS